jgi:hypothetical protein
MRGVLLVRGLGANLYSIGTATDTGIDFFSNNNVSFTRNGVVLMHYMYLKQYSPQNETALRAIKLQPL